MIYIDLILNLALLVALSVVSGFIDKRWPRQTRRGALLQGLVFGGAAVIGMLRPVNLGPGLIFDGRSVMVSLCALFFGPWAALVAVAMTAACRIALGGIGTLTGVLVLLSSAGIGIWTRLRYVPSDRPVSALNLYRFGLVVHLAMLAMLFTLPGGVAVTVIKRIGPAVMLLYPLATILAGKVLSDQLSKQFYMDSLQQSDDRLQSMMDNMLEGCQVIGKDWRYRYINNAAEAHNRRPASELLGSRYTEVWPGIEGTEVFRLIRQCMEQRTPHHIENQFVFPDGASGWYELSIQPVPEGVFILSTDITHRKESEKILKESEETFRHIFESANVGKSVTRPSGEVSVNSAFAGMLGYSRQELANKKWQDLSVADEIEATQKELKPLLTGEKDSARFIKRYVHRNGSHVWADVSVTIRRDGNGRPLHFITTIVDITQQKAAEEALKESEQRFRTALENIPDVVVLYGPDLRMRYINSATRRITGRPVSDFIGRRDDELWPPDIYESYLPTLRKARDTGTIRSVETVLTIPGSGDRYLSITCIPLLDADGRTQEVMGVTHDLTARKTAEMDLQAAKEQLETKVRERTAELRKLVDSMAGRELRMAELKAEIAQLLGRHEPP